MIGLPDGRAVSAESVTHIDWSEELQVEVYLSDGNALSVDVGALTRDDAIEEVAALSTKINRALVRQYVLQARGTLAAPQAAEKGGKQ
jgi:hypothetical protein